MLPLICFHWPAARSVFMPMVWLSHVSEDTGQQASRTPRTALAPPASRGRNDLQRHRAGLGVEEDARLPALELCAHLRHLLLEGILALAVVGTFAQHEGLYDAVQGLRGELPMRNDERLAALVRTNRGGPCSAGAGSRCRATRASPSGRRPRTTPCTSARRRRRRAR